MSAYHQKASALIVDNEELFRKSVKKQLTKRGFKCHEASCLEEALGGSGLIPIDLILLDNLMVRQSGIRVIPDLKKNYPKAALVMTTAVDNIDTVIACMKNGAHDYLPKPFESEELDISIGNALMKKKLEFDLKEYEFFNTQTTNDPKNYVRKSKLVSFDRLITELEVKDKYMAGHSRRVSGMALELGQLLGLNPIQLEEIRWGRTTA